MGRDKATLEVEGVAMAVRVAAALGSAGAGPVLAVGGDPVALGLLGLDVVPDDDPGAGPLPAVLTALRRASDEVVVVLACDLLAPSAASIRAVVAALEGAGPEVHAAVPSAAGHRQWTHAAWRRRAITPLAAARAAGVGSLRRAASSLCIVPVEGLPAGDLADADHPVDLPGAG